MDEPLAIKNREPTLRHMFWDYRVMFSGTNLKFMLWWAAVVIVLLGTYFLTPFGFTLDEDKNIILRVLVFFNTYFLFILTGLLAVSIVSPFLARLLFPLVINLLEIPGFCYSLFSTWSTKYSLSRCGARGFIRRAPKNRVHSPSGGMGTLRNAGRHHRERHAV